MEGAAGARQDADLRNAVRGVGNAVTASQKPIFSVVESGIYMPPSFCFLSPEGKYVRTFLCAYSMQEFFGKRTVPAILVFDFRHHAEEAYEAFCDTFWTNMEGILTRIAEKEGKTTEEEGWERREGNDLAATRSARRRKWQGGKFVYVKQTLLLFLDICLKWNTILCREYIL
ncbi:MAG: hypothetical protein AABZ39_04020 [Spirochaetota bacterium]